MSSCLLIKGLRLKVAIALTVFFTLFTQVILSPFRMFYHFPAERKIIYPDPMPQIYSINVLFKK